MKTIITISLALLLSGMIGSGPTPDKVQSAFAKKYPTIKEVYWEELSANTHVAYFVMADYDKEAHFKDDGSWLHTTTELDFEDLPKCVEKTIDDKYRGAELFNLETYEDPTTVLAYHVTIYLDVEPDEPEEPQDVEEDEDETWDDEEEIVQTSSHLKLIFNDKCKLLSEEEASW